jgi:hypothetical protein
LRNGVIEPAGRDGRSHHPLGCVDKQMNLLLVSSFLTSAAKYVCSQSILYICYLEGNATCFVRRTETVTNIIIRTFILQSPKGLMIKFCCLNILYSPNLEGQVTHDQILQSQYFRLPQPGGPSYS